MAADGRVHHSLSKVKLACSVCSVSYTDPLMLPCLHSFCKRCLIKVKNNEGASDGCIKCPTCHESAPLPGGKVEGLTHNLWLARQVKIASLKTNRDDKVNISCNRCVKQLNNSAVAYCSQCCLLLCPSCKDDHRLSQDTVNHELIDKEKIRLSDGKMPRLAIKCIKHVKEDVNMYCYTCEKVGCRNCIIVEHREHKVGNCSDITSDSCKEEMKPYVSHFNRDWLSIMVDEGLDNGEEMINQIKKRETKIKTEINEAYDLVQRKLELRRKALLQEAEEIASNKMMAVTCQMESFNKVKRNINETSDLIEAIDESDDTGEILSIKKLVKDSFTRCINEIEKLNLNIEENDRIYAYFDLVTIANKINCFGGVSTIPASSCSIDSGLGVPMATVGVERKLKVTGVDGTGKPVNDIPLVASLVSTDGNYDKKFEDVKITSSDDCTTTVSFVPERVGEMKVSLLVGGQHIYGSPCKISVKQKRNYSLLNDKVCTFNTGAKKVFGVAVDINGDVYASCRGGYVQVFDNNGTPTRRIGSSGDGDGQFKIPCGLVILGKQLYVADHDLHRVQMFSTINGHYMYQFGSNGLGPGQLNKPLGMAYDGKGHILVAEYGNRRVQVFTVDGTFVRVIDCDGQPVYDVAVDNDGNIHVPYYKQHIIQVFSYSGFKLCSYNNPNGNFQYPVAVAIDDEGHCFIGTNNNSSLLILDSFGRQVNVISAGCTDPRGIVFDREGHVYIVNNSTFSIDKY